jgi:NADH:ubiquinone oxidoreductase subunit F (NADH-binding)
MKPEDVIEEVEQSGLRGRGGAGFPTGIKWGLCRKSLGDEKYLICNADEGDPGAFMDRSVLEGDPYSVLEGMLIAAYAIGATEGYIYCRAEYPLALERVNTAIQKAREYGLLGKNILGLGFDFDISIKYGAGAFVCGEETALMASVEGKRGVPRPRPPYPATSGLWGKPTNINNVETLANLPIIISKSANWYRQFGTAKSKGTKTFSLAGKVKRTGLIEIPFGTTLREIIYTIGGGILGDKQFKAVQTGGPSGGCLSAEFLDMPIDYENMEEAGSIIGSGGMIVADEDTCIVDLAKFFFTFIQAESCGKCAPCRVGTRQMLDILDRITKGEGKPEDIYQLQRLSMIVKDGSLCALGGTAPNPVLTTIKYFRDEYEAHIEEKRCPAKACKHLINYYIDPNKCIGCEACSRSCPVACIEGGKKMVHVIDQDRCIKCGSCFDVCPVKGKAVVKVSGEKMSVPKKPIPILSNK